MADATGELREDIPLKSGTKNSRLWCCSEDCFGGSKLISVSFAVLTVIITFALILQIYYGDYQVVPHGSVATDSRECSKIGTSILKEGGNSADAVIASAFCLAVVNPHVTGLDAEGQFMIYNHRTRINPDVIDFRRNPNIKINEVLPRLVIGLAYIHQQYGKLAWRQLIEPSIYLAQRFIVPQGLVSAIKNANLQNLYGNLEAGQIISLKKLSVTLQNIAAIAEDDLYNYITLENTPVKSMALKSTFNNYNIYVPNIPSIGPELLSNLKQIGHFNFTNQDASKPEYIYRIAEITLNIYKELNVTTNFHEGTSSNVAVIDTDDTYVSLVTGMYQSFGSRELNSGGYILDVKNKPPTSCSRIPLIITDADFICGRRLVMGSSNIITATQIISSLLIAEKNATSSIESPRYNMFSDGTVGFEDEHLPSFTDEIIEYLESLGKPIHIKEPYSSCNIVEKVADDLNSHSDSRGGGIASRFR